MKTILFLKLLVVTAIALIGSLAFSSDKKTAEAKTTGSQPAVAQVSSDQPTASTTGEAKKKELYGNVPEDLEPFGTFVEKPYHRYFVASDAAITFWGPGREKPDPDVPTVKIGLLAPLERSQRLTWAFPLNGAVNWP